MSRNGKVSYLLRYYVEDADTGQMVRFNKTVAVSTEKEAHAELRKILATIDRGEHVRPQGSTLGDWIERWIRDYAPTGRANKTVERYAELLRLHVMPNLGSRPLQKLTALQIDGLYAKLRSEGRRPHASRRNIEGEPQSLLETRGLSEQTVLHVHRVLSLVLRVAVEKDLIARSPTDRVTAPSPVTKENRNFDAENDDSASDVLAMTDEQVAVLLGMLKGKDLFPLVVLDLRTGLRRGELLGLRWSDIDFDRGTVSVRRSVEEIRKMGIGFKPPKTKRSRRTIGVDRETLGLLRSLKSQQAELLLSLGGKLGPDSLVFPKSPFETRRPKVPNSVSTAWRRLVKGTGLAAFRLQDLRHTHATQLLVNKVPLHVVSARLGHSSPTVTLNVYAHVIPKAEDDAVSVAGSIGRGTVPLSLQ